MFRWDNLRHACCVTACSLGLRTSLTESFLSKSKFKNNYTHTHTKYIFFSEKKFRVCGIMYCLALFILMFNLFKFILSDVDVLMVYNDMFSSDDRSIKTCHFNHGVGVWFYCLFVCFLKTPGLKHCIRIHQVWNGDYKHCIKGHPSLRFEHILYKHN